MTEKKDGKLESVNALAKIVSWMQQLSDIGMQIEQYQSEYSAFADTETLDALNQISNKLKSVCRDTGLVYDQMDEKVQAVLNNHLVFPQYQILRIDQRLVRGQTQKAVILELTGEMKVFLPKSLITYSEDGKMLNYKYYDGFKISALFKSGNHAEIKTDEFEQIIKRENSELALKDQYAAYDEKVIEFFSNEEITGGWPYADDPEKLYENPQWKYCMQDLYEANDGNPYDIQDLAFLRSMADANTSVNEMKICKNYLYEKAFSDFFAITQMNENQCHMMQKMIEAVRSGKQELNDMQNEIESVFGTAEPVQMTDMSSMSI